MKKILFILFVCISTLFVFSCKTKSHDDHSGEHTHADGTAHADGDHEEAVTHDQESFEVDTTEKHDHDHDHGHDH